MKHYRYELNHQSKKQVHLLEVGVRVKSQLLTYFTQGRSSSPEILISAISK